MFRDRKAQTGLGFKFGQAAGTKTNMLTCWYHYTCRVMTIVIAASALASVPTLVGRLRVAAEATALGM